MPVIDLDHLHLSLAAARLLQCYCSPELRQYHYVIGLSLAPLDLVSPRNNDSGLVQLKKNEGRSFEALELGPVPTSSNSTESGLENMKPQSSLFTGCVFIYLQVVFLLQALANTERLSQTMCVHDEACAEPVTCDVPFTRNKTFLAHHLHCQFNYTCASTTFIYVPTLCLGKALSSGSGLYAAACLPRLHRTWLNNTSAQRSTLMGSLRSALCAQHRSISPRTRLPIIVRSEP